MTFTGTVILSFLASLIVKDGRMIRYTKVNSREITNSPFAQGLFTESVIFDII